MNALLVEAAALTIQEVVSLIRQYASGTPGADVLLQQWVDSVNNYKAAKAGFDAAHPKP